MDNKRFANALIAYSTAGLQLAIVLVLFVYGGYRLDLRLQTTPVFILLGSAVGMIAGLYNLLRGLKDIDRMLKQERKEGKEEKRTKWL